MEKRGTTQNKIIAVTGGIGSGKSAVLSIIKGLNYPVFSCDDFTKKAYKNKKVKSFLKGFCKNCFIGFFKTKIDRKTLAKLVFSSEEKRREFTSVITPVVYDLTMKKVNKLKGVKFVEVPLLFELEKENDFDHVLVVKRKVESRQKAVQKRSNVTEEDFYKIVNSQYDYKDVKNALVIENDGDLTALKSKVKDVIEKII